MYQYQCHAYCFYVAYFPTYGSEVGWPSPSHSYWLVPGTWED